MTNRAKISRAVLAATLAVAVSGCDDGLTDLNQNPNEPTVVGADYLFTNAVEASVSRVTGSGLNMDLTGLWVQHYAESRYTAEDRYELTDQTVSGHWEGFYSGPLQDFQEVRDAGRDRNRPNVQAMGTIMQTWTYQVVTDLWGAVGYSEALRGRAAGASLGVKFDPQEAVYTGLLAELKSASAMIQPGGLSLGRADPIYRSDMAKWRKFANSLRMRVAMRMSEADPAKARAEFAAALSDGPFTANADNAVLRYVDNGINVHPIFAYQRNRDDHAVSATLVDTLARLGDPRLAIYAEPNRRGDFRGMPNGVLADPPLDSISRIGRYFSRADAPSVLMSYAEVLLLQAEAAQRGWTGGDPAALYRQAITAHMQQLGVPQSQITTYLARPGVAYRGLPSIHLQKWIALYGNGPEAYAEWRRTGFPLLAPGPDALNDGLIPVRLPYPAVEQSLNGASLAQVAGGASLNDRVWWDRP